MLVTKHLKMRTLLPLLLLTIRSLLLLFIVASPQAVESFFNWAQENSADSTNGEENLFNLQNEPTRKLNANVCLPPGAFFLEQLKSAKSRRKVLEETLKHSFDAYLEHGWAMGKSVQYFSVFGATNQPPTDVNLKVVLDAMNTFKLLGMSEYYHKASHYVAHHLPKVFRARLLPPSLSLYPSLVTAYHLTGNRKYYNHAVDIGLHEVRHLWPLEAAVLHSAGSAPKRAEYLAKLETDFDTLFDEHTYDRDSMWKHYWMLVNLHRYSAFSTNFTITNFNYWLRLCTETVAMENFELTPKLFSTRRWPKLQYISPLEGSMHSVDCAWGATMVLASQATVDSVVLSRRPTVPADVQLVWSDARLLNTGLNITDTCRLGAAVSPHRLPLHRMALDEDLEEVDEATLATINQINGGSGNGNGGAGNGYDDLSADIAFGGGSPHKFLCEPSNFLRSRSPPTPAALSSTYHLSSMGSYQLQSQLALSYFVAYRVTRNEYYREFAWEHFLALVERCQKEPSHAYASLTKDGEYGGLVNVLKYSSDPAEQASVFFGEVMRYLYLTFDDVWKYPLQKYVFTANGNVFPIEE